MNSTETTVEENKAIYKKYIDDIFNKGHIERIAEYLAPDYEYREAPPHTPPGASGVVSAVKMFRAAFPDLQITFQDQFGEGDRVCSRTITQGTHLGTFMGIAPTNKKVVMPGITIARIVEGKISESWVKNDVVALLKQIGATSLPSA